MHNRLLAKDTAEFRVDSAAQLQAVVQLEAIPETTE